MKVERQQLEDALGKLSSDEKKAESLRDRKDVEGAAVRQLLEVRALVSVQSPSRDLT